jgi:hypothetical protein
MANMELTKLRMELTEPSSEAYKVIMTTDSFALLRARRREIAEEAKDLRTRLETLESEDAELASAEKVLLRFGAVPSEPVARPASDFSSGKPEGTPTTPNMILALLREAKAQGKPGLEPKDMQVAIARRWWPSVKSDDVGPTAWRMWKDGRLIKDGSLYSLPTETRDLVREAAASFDDLVRPPREEKE